MSEIVLAELGLPEEVARRTVQLFRKRDELALTETHAYANDEPALIQNSEQVAAELQGILEADQAQEVS